MTEITEAKEDPPSGRHFRTFGHGSFGGCCQLEKVCLDGESILLLPRTAHSENPLALSQTLSPFTLRPNTATFRSFLWSWERNESDFRFKKKIRSRKFFFWRFVKIFRPKKFRKFFLGERENVCVCVCVWERERERERKNSGLAKDDCRILISEA